MAIRSRAVTRTLGASPSSGYTPLAPLKSCALVEGVCVMMQGMSAPNAACSPMRLSSTTMERDAGTPSLFVCVVGPVRIGQWAVSG